jgi:MOSC domain-containing protein YiiM
VQGRIAVHRLNLEGDGQGDLAGHGGEHRAVMVYQMDAYHYWEAVLGRTDFSFGQFGENFTVAGLPDDEVCIGDRYRIGTSLFEVTQPRVTCYRVGEWLSRRWRLCSSRTTALASTFACWKKARLALGMRSRK